MISTAFLIGNANYEFENDLPCCATDVAAMQALIEATGRFDVIRTYIDLDADALRNALRRDFPKDTEQNEVFFYFSGHGAQVGSNFYYCCTTYDSNSPNQTGISHAELLDIFRSVAPCLLIKVIDACFSGAPLVKGERPPLIIAKEGFRNVLQFSSSLDDQTSLAGDPLSAFTRAFLEASVRRSEGTVYYTDIVNTIRDGFLSNEDQTPFFVNQGTGREILVDDATKLSGFRSKLELQWRSSINANAVQQSNEGESAEASAPTTPKQLLMAAEERMGGPDDAKALIDNVLGGLLRKINQNEFSDFFETEVTEHSDYLESTTKEFMIRVLSREPRSDRLVTAEIRTEKKKCAPWETTTTNLMMAMSPNWAEYYELGLNCKLERAQIKITLFPKYRSLQQLKLVLSFAPSLERCYLFEVVSQHPRADWNAFDHRGREIVRRWYKLDWNHPTDSITDDICEALQKAVFDHIDETAKRLALPTQGPRS